MIRGKANWVFKSAKESRDTSNSSAKKQIQWLVNQGLKRSFRRSVSSDYRRFIVIFLSLSPVMEVCNLRE